MIRVLQTYFGNKIPCATAWNTYIGPLEPNYRERSAWTGGITHLLKPVHRLQNP